MKDYKQETLEENFKHLWTAEKSNKNALFWMWHDHPQSGDAPIECTAPDIDTAKAYYEAVRIRKCVWGGTPYLLDRKYTSEEADEYWKKEKMYNKMHLDMRNQIVIGENGKKGLRDVMGIVLIDPQFDDIPEFYTCFEQTTLVPVVLANRYYLYDTKNRKTLTKGYDRIFRYFGAYINYFVAVENGKKSILDASSGHELTPIIMDEVYEMQDEDGAIPMLSDGKAAFLWGETYTGPIFERALIFSECFTEVMYNGEWGWIDCDGKFTKEKSKASFGSWYDCSK